VWRNFENWSSPEQVIPLLGVIRVAATAQATLPPDVRAVTAWVSFGPCVWVTPVDERNRTGNTIEATLHGVGPAWGPGPWTEEPDVEVDVVIALTDGSGRKAHLRAQRVPIVRAW
jgi:hypothetical protein